MRQRNPIAIQSWEHDKTSGFPVKLRTIGNLNRETNAQQPNITRIFRLKPIKCFHTKLALNLNFKTSHTKGKLFMTRSSSLVKWKIWIFYSWQTLTSFYCKLCKIIRNICIFAKKWISGHFVWWTIPLNLKLYRPSYWSTGYLFSLANRNSYLSTLNSSIKSQNALALSERYIS